MLLLDSLTESYSALNFSDRSHLRMGMLSKSHPHKPADGDEHSVTAWALVMNPVPAWGHHPNLICMSLQTRQTVHLPEFPTTSKCQTRMGTSSLLSCFKPVRLHLWMGRASFLTPSPDKGWSIHRQTFPSLPKLGWEQLFPVPDGIFRLRQAELHHYWAWTRIAFYRARQDFLSQTGLASSLLSMSVWVTCCSQHVYCYNIAILFDY